MENAETTNKLACNAEIDITDFDAFGNYLVAENHRAVTIANLSGHVARRRFGNIEQILWDKSLPGFGLRVQPTGHKAWIVKYRRRGKQKFDTLGAVGELSAHEARARARALLARVAADGLPKAPTHRQAPLFADYAETFWTDYARHWKPRTQKTTRGLIDRELKPRFGALRVDVVRKTDVLAWRDDLHARPHAFNRALPVLSVMMKYSEQMGYRRSGSNPCRRSTVFATQPKERFLTEQEYGRLGTALALAEPDAPDVVDIIRLLMLTGARCSEIAELQWEWVQPPRLMLPDSKTGPKVIHLCSEAVAVLAGRERSDANPWVFPDRRRERPVTAARVGARWTEIRRAAALPDVRLHDLRHSFASVAINRGVSLVTIGRLLGHALPETTARYAHLEDRSIVEAAHRVSRSLGQALGVL